MKQVAVLPVDDRPVNYDYPRCLGRAAGLQVHLPPREWLGNPWRPSRHQDLVGWLKDTAPQVDALIISADTLGYGGLIPSRKSAESTEAVLARLGVLRELQASRPDRPILASSVVLRIHRSDSAEEEKPYWATYGARMFRLSFLEHKAEMGDAAPAETAERDALRGEIPSDVYDDYRRGRARNHDVNRAMLDWLDEGVFDYLLLPQDDTADYGWNIAEARRLQSLIRARGLTDRAITYPGADEVGCVLLARYVCRLNQFAPRVWPHYSGVTGPTVVTAYEDRPVHEMLKAQLAPLVGVVAESPETSDFSLFLNAPIVRQGNADSQWLIRQGVDQIRAGMPPAFQPWLDRFTATEGFRGTRREMESPRRSPEEFVRSLLAAVRAGRPVALADVAFVNGADMVLGDLLQQHAEIASLASYSAWNTAGNTLGTALAQAVIHTINLRTDTTADQRAAHLEFLFLRFLDDECYQARVRSQCMMEDLPALGLAPTHERLPDSVADAIENQVRERLAAAVAKLRDRFIASRLVRDVRVTHIHLPWRRLFEVGCDVAVDVV